MGCVASKKVGGTDVVSLCRGRKQLLELAIERRYAFAEAQSKYNQSLYAVALAVRLFVARHSSTSSPLLITYPSSETLSTEPKFLQQRPTQPLHEAIPFQTSESFVYIGKERQNAESVVNKEKVKHVQCLDPDNDHDEDDDDDQVPCEHFYDEVGPQLSSLNRGLGWDFFDLVDSGGKTDVVADSSQTSEDNLRKVREEEGIPNLEEDEERVCSCAKRDEKVNFDGAHSEKNDGSANAAAERGARFKQEGKRGLKMCSGRELLEALKDVEDHCLRAYESGLDVSKMLEASKVRVLPNFEEIIENSSKLIQSSTWNRTALHRSSSCRSLVTSSSKNSSSWTESENDLFDTHGGMEAGSHSLTLGRLYAWEKKLYEEVKIGEETTKIYKRRCSGLKNKDVRGDDFLCKDRYKAELRELHTKILVSLRSVESISMRIQKLRDEELHPQLFELLHGLIRNWKITLEIHEIQSRTMFDVSLFSCSAYGKFRNESHRLATLQLETEIQSWRACFSAYISSQKAYVEALASWLSKFLVPESSSFTTSELNEELPLLVTCNDWLACLEKLPTEAVMAAMKSFGDDIHALWVQQGEEHEQKRKVDGLAKEVESKVSALRRAENRILVSQKSDADLTDRIKGLAEKRDQLDLLQEKLETEKAKHQNSMKQTQEITINGFQSGFSSVFECLAEFSKASVQMYADLVTHSGGAEKKEEKERERDSNISYIEEISTHM